MASNHQVTDARLSSLRTESDEAANAPEVDRCAMQVFFDNSPPEATDVEPPDQISNSLSGIATLNRKSRRMRIILVLAAIAMVLIALGIGLGLGLSHGKQPGPNVTANSTVTNQVSAKPYHSMADDTAVAAITLSNGNRQVFFQEESGYIRRALYSAEAGIWQTSIESNLGSPDSPASILPLAKNSTPLAAAVRRIYSFKTDENADDFGESFYFNCFTKQHNGEAFSEMDGHNSETLTQESKFAEFIFDVDISNGNITIDKIFFTLTDNRPLDPKSESTLVSADMDTLWRITGPDVSARRIWFKSRDAESPTIDGRPSLNAPFPFQRLSTTSTINTTKTYLYHQINESVLGEEYWDGTSGFWISTNITIDTSDPGIG
ncbi:MAG: hypothetical protein Q9204_004538 [Flavoplaca sp. TL-2023a]